MRILQISNYYYPHIGGVEQTARDITNSLKDEHDVKVFCFNEDACDDSVVCKRKETVTDVVDGIDVKRCGCITKKSSQSISLCYKKQLKKMMNEFKPEMVVFHYPNPFAAHYLKKFLKRKNFKFILYWHLDITKQKILGKLFAGQNKFLLNRADKIVATSPNYIEGSPWLSANKEKCVVIPSCINEERLAYDDLNIDKANRLKEKYLGKKICFTFGRHVEYKGIEYLIKASKYLSDEYVILIGGQGPLTNKLKKEASSDSKIVFVGKLSDDDLKSYLLACDVFCFPSITKNEAFGLGLAEAMYYGKPAITFNIQGSGVNYVNINNITGIEVENRNIVEYANAIKKLGADLELREKCGGTAKKRVESDFLYSSFEKSIKYLLEGENHGC